MKWEKDQYDIFISYFRNDAGGWTAMLHRALCDNLPTYQIFKDDVETEAGTEWQPRLERLVRKCRFFLVVISDQWNKPEFQTRLAEEGNWVRKEILAARTTKRHIIPVLVNGAQPPTGLPDEIQSIVDAKHCFFFSRGTTKWDEEAARLCRDITGHARNNQSRDNLTRLFSNLDRGKETPLVRAAVKEGCPVVAVRGGAHDEPLVFAQRCGQDVNEDGHFSEAFVGPFELRWKPFLANPDETLRRGDLLMEIAKGCVLETDGDLQRKLNAHFRYNQQTLVFYTIVSSGGKLAVQRIVEWLSIWEPLLESVSQGRVVALIFAPRGWLFTRRLPNARSQNCETLQTKGLGLVDADDVKDFVNELHKVGKLSGPQKEQIQAVTRWLFMLSVKRRLKKVKDKVAPILLH